MPRRITQTTLNATTVDIINVIRQNASYNYQQNVPTVDTETDIPRVGEYICGTPAFANEFINALLNRIALVTAQSAIFNNPYSHLKKGFLEFGETVEEIFVGLAKAVHYSAEKAPAREFKRTLPDVKSAFHTMNWRVMYPLTIQRQELQRAFLSAEGVTDLITRLVEQMYTAVEYDEFLLFKYMLIKAISHGKFKPLSIGDGTDMKEDATMYRGISNGIVFMSDKYNESGVRNNTPKERQAIFMDAMYNAQYDVNVLASAFNMDKADFMGRLHLIDDWTSFDNERFDIIREESDGIEEVTASELALLENLKAIIVDTEWFQVYDNLFEMTETPVNSGLYWNYFLHTWKTISNSPFANAIAFFSDDATIENPDSVTVRIASKDVSDIATVFTLEIDDSTASVVRNAFNFVQTEALTTNGIAVQRYGAIIIPKDKVATAITLEATLDSDVYEGATTITGASDVGDTVVLNKE